MAIITTAGSATANSYASVAELDAYAENRLPVAAAFATASDELKEAALIAAARGIDANIDWTGVATVPETQAMTWPRAGMLNRNKYAIANTVIPVDLKNAQCEFAYQLIAGADKVSDDDAAAKGVASLKAGSVAIGFQTVNTATEESVDMILRRLGNEFAYLTAVPGEVRRLLVSSWFNQPSIKRPILFDAM